VFEGLRAASVGDLSTRYANAMRRKLLENIRHDLSEKYRAKGTSYSFVFKELIAENPFVAQYFDPYIFVSLYKSVVTFVLNQC